MLKWIIGALVALGVGVALATPGPVVIDNDYGGVLYTYDQWYNRLKRAEVPIRVEGMCISACTLVLSLSKEQVCVTPSASFGFHLASDEDGDDPDFTAALINRYYPAPVKNWLATKKLGKRPVFLPASEVVKMGVFRFCD